MDFSGENLMKYLPEIVKMYDKQRILPKFFNATGKVLEEIQDLIDNFIDILDVDKCDEQYLPYISNLVGWRLDQEKTVEEQRAQIKTALIWYKNKGTKKAYANMFRLLGYEIKLEELWKDRYDNLYTSATKTSAVYYGNSVVPGDWDSKSSITTNTLYGVHFHDNNNGIVVGQNGKLMYTEDGALTWQAVNTNTFVDINAIGLHTAPYYFLVGNNGTLLKYHFVDKLVSTIPITTDQNLNDIEFSTEVVDYTGYIVGSGGSIWKSVDGTGLAWFKITTGYNDPLFGLAVIDKDTMYAVGSTNRVLRTFNAGGSFDLITIPGVPTDQVWVNTFFKDANTGWVFGSGGRLASTTNGGGAWTVVQLDPDSTLQDMAFSLANPNIGFIVGTNNLFMYTIDAGISWDPVPNILDDLFAVFCINDRGRAVGVSGALLRNTDTSNPPDWNYISLNNPFQLNDLIKVGSSTFYSVGDNGTILISINDGLSWFPISGNPIANDLFVAYHDTVNDILYVGGTRSTLYKIENQGGSIANPTGTWVYTNMSVENSVRRIRGIVTKNDGTPIISGQGGLLFKWDSILEIWEDISENTIRVFSRIYKANDKILICADYGYVWYSTDDGDTFTEYDLSLEVTNEVVGTGDGVTKEFSFTLVSYPVRPLSVVIETIDENGNPLIARDLPRASVVGDVNYNAESTNTISYGMITDEAEISVQFIRPPKNGEDIVVSYRYNCANFKDAWISTLTQDILIVGSNTQIYKSYDNLTTGSWGILDVTGSYDLYRIHNIENNSIFVSGSKGYIAKTEYPFATAFDSITKLDTGEVYDYQGLWFPNFTGSGYLVGGNRKIKWSAIQVLLVRAIGEAVMTQELQRLILERIRELLPIHVVLEAIVYQSTFIDEWEPDLTDLTPSDGESYLNENFFNDSVLFTDLIDAASYFQIEDTQRFEIVPINYRRGTPSSLFSSGGRQMFKYDLDVDNFSINRRGDNVYPYPQVTSLFGEFLNMKPYQITTDTSNMLLNIPLDDPFAYPIGKEVWVGLHIDHIGYGILAGSLGNDTLKADGSGHSLITHSILNGITDRFSAECFVKFDSIIGNEVFFSQADTLTTNVRWYLRRNTNTIEFAVSQDGTTIATRISNTVILANTWYHIVGVYNGSTSLLDIYIDSILENSTLIGVVPISVFNNANMSISATVTNTDNLQGYLSLIKLYSNELLLTEIEQSYDNTYKLYKYNVV